MLIVNGPRKARLHLDRERIVPGDPGADTPALVEWQGHWGTFGCASECGEVDGVELPQAVYDWLNGPIVAAAMESYFEGCNYL